METNTIPPAVSARLPAAPSKGYEIWWDVWRHPGKPTFQGILNEPFATLFNGYKYTILMGLISGLVVIISKLLSQINALKATSGLWGNIIIGLVGNTFLPAIALAIVVAYAHEIAKLFGGTGTWGILTYCFAAILAPAYLIITIFHIIPYFSVSIPILILVIVILYLFACAISAVEKVGTWVSIVMTLFPVIIVVIFFVVYFAIIAYMSL
jgi:hypothetical protein